MGLSAFFLGVWESELSRMYSRLGDRHRVYPSAQI